MSMTVSSQAALSYGNYNLKNSEEYKKYAVDSSEVSKEYYNISSVSSAVEAMNNAIDSSSPYVGKVDSYVKSQLNLSQLNIYDKLSSAIDSYNVSGVLNNDTDLSDMYDLANASNLVSEDAISNILKSNGYISSAATSYSSYLSTEESSTTGLLDVTV